MLLTHLSEKIARYLRKRKAEEQKGNDETDSSPPQKKLRK